MKAILIDTDGRICLRENDIDIPFEDQRQAQEVVIQDYLKRGDAPPFRYRGALVIGLGECVCPFPEDQYKVEIKESPVLLEDVTVAVDGNFQATCPLCMKYHHFMGTGDMYCHNHKVALLSSIVLEEESQTELWLDVARTMDAHSEMHRISILMKQFTITRNSQTNEK